MRLRTRLNVAAGRILDRTGRWVGPITRYQVRSHGVRVDVSSPIIADSTRAALFWGYYEGSERRASLRYLRPELPVIEVGASLGFLTALIAKKVRPLKQVAVEANPALIPLLRRTLALNGVSHVDVVAAAIAYGRAEVDFAEGADTASGRVSQEGGATRVPTCTIGDLLPRVGAGPFGLVCDIEGAEYELFENEPKEVSERCHLAVMELHEVTRAGRRFERAALAAHLAAKWGMRIRAGDGKVWVFER